MIYIIITAGIKRKANPHAFDKQSLIPPFHRKAAIKMSLEIRDPRGCNWEGVGGESRTSLSIGVQLE